MKFWVFIVELNVALQGSFYTADTFDIIDKCCIVFQFLVKVWFETYFSSQHPVWLRRHGGEHSLSVWAQRHKERRGGGGRERKDRARWRSVPQSESLTKHTPLPVLSSCHMAWRCLATLFRWRITPDGELPARSVRGEDKPKVKAAGWAADRKVWELNGRGTDTMIAPKLEFLISLSFWDSFALAQAVLEQYMCPSCSWAHGSPASALLRHAPPLYQIWMTFVHVVWVIKILNTAFTSELHHQPQDWFLMSRNKV